MAPSVKKTLSASKPSIIFRRKPIAMQVKVVLLSLLLYSGLVSWPVMASDLVDNRASIVIEEKKIPFDIPAQPVEKALIEFTRQSRAQVVLSQGVFVDNLTSTAIVGELSPQQALRQLLDETELRVQQASSGDFIILMSERDQPLAKMEEILVTAHQRDYRLDSADTALGLGLKILKTPAAISVISADLLQDQQVNNVDDALRNVAGVAKFKTGNGGEERFAIRAFDASQSIYKDGARINNPLNASNIPSTETANIERIEVLKGASALLYGQGEPGGIINYITKRPGLEQRTTIEVLGGSDSFKKVEIDTTGPFGKGDSFAYRLVGAYQDSDSFRDEVLRERLLLNPSISFSPSTSSQIVLGYEYIDDEYTQDRGQVLDGNAADGYFFSNRQDETQFYGIPGWNQNTTAESSRIYLIAEHQFTENWRIEANFNKTNNDKVNFDSSPIGISAFDLSGSPANLGAVIGAAGTPVENLVAIQPRKTVGEGEATRYSLKNYFDLTDSFGFEHQILVSVSKEELSTESTSFRGGRQTIVFYNVDTRDTFSAQLAPIPAENQVVTINPSLIFDLQNRGSSLNQEFEEIGVNILDYINFNDHWALLIGGRYSKYEDKLRGFEDDNFSLRAGIVYSVDENLSFYASYSEGYTNSGGNLNQSGQQIDPETSVSLELGAKLQLLEEKLLLTATLYRTEQADIAFVVNPAAPRPEQFFDNIGAILSQGIELEAVGYINENWRIQAGYSYIDNEITESSEGNGFQEGNALGGIGEHNFNLFSFYEFSIAEGFIGLGGGIYYQDDVFISAQNNAKYDSWTQVDLGAYYRQDSWKFQLNVKNVTDEEYRQAQVGASTDSFAAVRVGTATPRSLLASIAYEF